VLMHDYPELTFTHSQPATYEVIRQREPALFERIRATTYERIREEARDVLRPFTTSTGRVEAPLEAHLVAARPRRLSRA